MKSAFVYCRVSTEEQSREDHYSLALQEERCRAYAKQRGWRVAKVRKDTGSGKDDQRSGYQELRQAMTAGDIDVVVVYRLDRLSRNVRDVYDFLNGTSEAGIGFASTSGAFDTTTAMGRAMLGVAAVFAQLTREMIGENTRDGLAKRAQSGKYNGVKSPSPYGYDYKDGHLVINRREAAVVRRIFDAYVRHGRGVTAIAGELNHAGIPGKRGGQWSRSQIARMLRSPLYAGKIVNRDHVHEGAHTRLIDEELFDQAQRLRAARSILPPRAHQSQHLLSGIARCGLCGSRLRAHWILTGIKRSRDQKRYRTYHHRALEYGGDRYCRGVHKGADKLEAAVLEKVREVAGSSEFQEAAFEEARKRLAQAVPAVVDEREAAEAQLQALDRRFNLWATQLESGNTDDEQFRKRNEGLLREKAGLQERLAELRAREAEAEAVEVNLDQVRRTLANFDQVWDAMTIDEQREMLRGLVEHLKVWKDRAELKLVFFPPMEIPVVFKRGPVAKGLETKQAGRKSRS
jgi:site-specific DNA recombinase